MSNEFSRLVSVAVVGYYFLKFVAYSAYAALKGDSVQVDCSGMHYVTKEQTAASNLRAKNMRTEWQDKVNQQATSVLQK